MRKSALIIALTFATVSAFSALRQHNADHPTSTSSELYSLRHKSAGVQDRPMAYNLTLKIKDASSAGNIRVEIDNSSKKKIRVWKDSNSWGSARWRVLRIHDGRLETFFQNPDEEFTRNLPAFDEIREGGHIEAKLNLNGGNWCGLGRCSRFDQNGFGQKYASFGAGDTLIVMYDVPFTSESLQLGVWYGVAATSVIVH